MPDDPCEVRWISYSELAKARGIDRLSAMRIARKHKWAKQPGNDGTVRLAVPLSFLEAKKRDPKDHPSDEPREHPSDLSHIISELQAEVRALHERLAEQRELRAKAEGLAEARQAEIERLITLRLSPESAPSARRKRFWWRIGRRSGNSSG